MTSVDEATQDNPYAAPQAALQRVQRGPKPGVALLYPMSARKAAVMSVLTMGLYDLAFWYRHWKRVRESGQDANPIVRTIFAPITAFSFLTHLSTLRAARGLESSRQLRATPIVYLGATLLSVASLGLDVAGMADLAITMVECACAAWVLATIQRGVNEVLVADNYLAPTNTGVSWTTMLAVGFGLALWTSAVLDAVSPK